MQQRFFNTSRWLDTRSNNQISTFSHSGIFPLFPTLWSLQTFLNKICNHQTHCHHYTIILWKNSISWSKTLFSTLVDLFMRFCTRKWWGKGWIIKNLDPMSRDFFLENSGSHTQSSNQQHHSIKVTPVQFFFRR